MLTGNEITEIFYLSDEFSKGFAFYFKNMFYMMITAKGIEISQTGWLTVKL